MEWKQTDPAAVPEGRGDPTGGGSTYPEDHAEYRGHYVTRKHWSSGGASFVTYRIYPADKRGWFDRLADIESTWEGDMQCDIRYCGRTVRWSFVIDRGKSMTVEEVLDRVLEALAEGESQR